jgi:subtilase family serine protease
MALNLRGLFLRTLFPAVFFAAVLFAAVPATAQQVALHPRITAQVENSRRTSIVSSRSPMALAANDMGAVSSNMPLHGIAIAFSRTPAQQSALDQLAAAQQNPAAPEYHHWLTPSQYGSRFGVADADIAVVKAWLEQQGFAVDSVSSGRNRINFSGTAGQVQTAFGASLHNYKSSGETTSHFAPSADLSIPSALAGVVQGIGNLSDYRPHSQAVIQPASLQPQYSWGTQVVWLTPPDVATIYDVNPAYNSGYNGSGQTIAIVGQSAVDPQDLANFQTAIGVPINPQPLFLIPGTGPSTFVSGDETESDLDLEYASAMAPGATVAFYYVGPNGGGVFGSLEYVIDNDLAQIISISYAGCEPVLGSGYMDAELEQAAIQGQTVIAAAGDHGATACEEYMSSPVTQKQTPAVEYPASSPWVVGIGGTQFSAASVQKNPINLTYWAPSQDGGLVDSALSYMPEEIWDDYGWGLTSAGGGVSIFEPRPLWQKGVPGITDGDWRLVPDISLNSSDIGPGYLMCSGDTGFSRIAGSCADGFRNAAGYAFNVIGGTSVATPIFAGLVALLNEAKGYTSGQGLINPTLYTLAANPTTYASAFHDITVGGNNCTDLNVCGVGPQNTEYMAGVGYDQASGLGSIDFANLLAAWPAPSTDSPTVTTTSLSASSSNSAFGSTVTLTATVANGGIGNVTFFNGEVTLGSSVVDGNGMATLSLSSLPVGANSITAAYVGAAQYAPSSSTPITVTVVPTITTTTLYASLSSVSFGSIETLWVQVLANSTSVLSGPVTFLSNGTSVGSATVASGMASIVVSTLPGGIDTLTASYAGTANLAASTSSPVTVTVIPANVSVTLMTSSTSPTYGSNVALTATLMGNGNPLPGGVVTFISNGSPIGSGTVSNGVATISLSTLPSGLNSVSASFGGTSNFSSAVSSPVLVTVAPATTTTVLTASSTNPGFGSSVTLTVSVSAGGSPATGGVVSFFNGATALGIGMVNGNGVASTTLTTLPVGNASIYANYGGTLSFGASLSNVVGLRVVPATTTTALTASPTNPAFGSSVTFMAAVSANGSPATSGGVNFLNGGNPIGSGTVVNGVATVSLSTLPSGADSITANFGGTSNLAASSSNAVLVTVAPAVPVVAATTTMLSASSASATSGDMVTFTVVVSSGGAPVTTGVVQLLDGGYSIGAGTVNSSGVMTISVSTLPVGSNLISAYYGGTANFAASLSSAITETVTAPANPEPPATITVATLSPVSPGSSTTAAVKLVTNSYAGTMTLTCALTSSPVGAQYLPTCNVTASTLTVAVNATAASILTVQTTSTTTTSVAHPSHLTPWGLGGSTAVAGLLMLCVPNRRRRTTFLLALLLVVFSLGAVGCGGGKTTQVSPVTQSTTAGAYTFTVKGTDVVNPSTTTTAIVTVAVE